MRITEVITTIQRNCNTEGEWQLATESLCGLLELAPVDFYRMLYAQKERLHYDKAIDHFTHENTGDLITVLEALGVPGAEEALAAAGLFIPYDTGIELMEALLRTVHAALATHQVDYETAAAMLKHTGTLWAAFKLYLGEYFPAAPLLEEALRSCVEARQPAACFLPTARRYLRSLLDRHVLEWQELFRVLYAKLAARFQPQGSGERAAQHTPAQRARRLFGFDSGPLGRERLRQRYKELMKRYHPDINPAGLEKAKRINAAYALLLDKLREAG